MWDIESQPPSWLNEMVPFNGSYYSVFPLGAVLSVLPVALLQKVGWIHAFPARGVAALIAGLCVFFFFRLSRLEGRSLGRRILLALFPVFGTWLWCNLGFAGAWQTGTRICPAWRGRGPLFHVGPPASSCSQVHCLPWLFGNRTELILTLPVYLYFLSVPPAGDNRALLPEGEAMAAGKLAADH